MYHKKEVCLLDLLREEKEAVQEYNLVVSCIKHTRYHCQKIIKDNPENKNYAEQFMNDYSVKQESKIKIAKSKIGEVREKIRDYFYAIDLKVDVKSKRGKKT